MGYQWERIFKDKTEKELVQIYRGDSHLDFEAGIYAGLELINRNYDFNRIREIHIQRIQQMEGEVESLRKLKFTNTKYFRNMLLGGIPLLGFAGAILQNPPDLGQMDDYHLFQFLVGGFILLAGVVVPKWTYNRFRRRVEREIARNLTLLQKISFPGMDAVPS